MDLLVVIPAQLLLLVGIPLAKRNLDVTGRILAADHEADLARRVGRDRRVGVFDHGEHFLAGFLELGDEREMQPLVFGYSGTKENARGEGELAGWVMCLEKNKRKKKIKSNSGELGGEKRGQEYTRGKEKEPRCNERRRTTLCRHHAAVTEGAIE